MIAETVVPIWDISNERLIDKEKIYKVSDFACPKKCLSNSRRVSEPNLFKYFLSYFNHSRVKLRIGFVYFLISRLAMLLKKCL